jgi:hypothetical protein
MNESKRLSKQPEPQVTLGEAPDHARFSYPPWVALPQITHLELVIAVDLPRQTHVVG